MTTDLKDIIDLAAVETALSNSESPLVDYRHYIKTISDAIADLFTKGHEIERLLSLRADALDALLTLIWRRTVCQTTEEVTLLALGGYGRRELHPHSDIDIMILLNKAPSKALGETLSDFLTILWDLHLAIGHSVRTVKEAQQDAKKDLALMTSITESRVVFGDEQLFEQLKKSTSPKKIWPAEPYFTAKRAEQKRRHARFDNTAYKLEPNVKKTPGGLREIQLITWVAKRYFAINQRADLVAHDYLTAGELKELEQSLLFLWRVRFAIHVITGRAEDRLLFDHQKQVAELLGYEGNSDKALIEALMQDYYKTVMSVRELSEMLLMLFAELITKKHFKPKPLTEAFVLLDDKIAASSDTVFKQQPSALLSMFLIIADNPEIQTIHPKTIRAIRLARDQIDDEFRQNPENQQLFMAILRHPKGPRQLIRMKRLGILGRYIAEFGAVTGQMQYDLFHIYTVDEHTLFVIQHIYHLSTTNDAQTQETYPKFKAIFDTIEHPECLYIAALFHDIAKGRGGDHSELGGQDVEKFCKTHQMNAYQTRLIAWLVKRHLLMSMTAQKKDISDPFVVNTFAAEVRDKTHLDYLYLLTVADISATNKSLWNHWRASLLKELYTRTLETMSEGRNSGIDKHTLIKETKRDALALLEHHGLTLKTVLKAWRLFDEDFFLKQTPEDIAWQTKAIVLHGERLEPLIKVRSHPTWGGTEVLVYCPDQAFLFGRMANAFLRMGMTIVNASIMGAKNHYAVDTYLVLDANTGLAIKEQTRLARLQQGLKEQLIFNDRCVVDVEQQIPRRIRQFSVKTEVKFSQDQDNHHTLLEVISLDRPGLLAHIGNVFFENAVLLQSARIMTIGERVEDVFCVTDINGDPIVDETRQAAIRAGILQLQSQS